VPYTSTTERSSTRHGRYIIGLVEPHESKGRWKYSVVPWGAPIRLNRKGHVEVYMHSRWTLLHTLPKWRDDFLSDPLGAREDLEDEYQELSEWLKQKFTIGTKGSLPGTWGKALPQTWVFNDFGQVAIKYFVDYNGNGRLDAAPKRGIKREELLTDFLHTTNYFEMVNILNRELHQNKTMELGQSHGCVHMVPDVMQEWVRKGILKVGAQLQIHEYAVTLVPRSFKQPVARVGQEIHFFPGAKKIALYNVAKI
jgi:hypothetical protein